MIRHHHPESDFARREREDREARFAKFCFLSGSLLVFPALVWLLLKVVREAGGWMAIF